MVPERLAPSTLCLGGKEAPWAEGPVPQRGRALTGAAGAVFS